MDTDGVCVGVPNIHTDGNLLMYHGDRYLQGGSWVEVQDVVLLGTSPVTILSPVCPSAGLAPTPPEKPCPWGARAHPTTP